MLHFIFALEKLHEYFSKYGEVTDSVIMIDGESNKPRSEFNVNV